MLQLIELRKALRDEHPGTLVASEQRYIAYILRLWQVKRDEGPVWQASLQDVRTGERLGFASVERLVAFLKDQTGGDQREADLGSTTS